MDVKSACGAEAATTSTGVLTGLSWLLAAGPCLGKNKIKSFSF